MDISVVIVNWNTKELLLGCLASVFETMKGMAFEVWLVDNGSHDGSVGAVRTKYSLVKIIENQRNLGFAGANNQAFRRMKGRYALLLNTDTVLTEGAVQELYAFMESNSGAGQSCGQLLNDDGSKQNSIANFPSLLSLLCNQTLLRILLPKQFPSKRKEYAKPIEVDSGIGACLMVRKKAMDEIGLLDESYFFFLEETDWAYRMKRAGWKIYFVPTARIFHFQGQSVGANVDSRVMYYRSRYIYFRKWHKRSYPIVRIVIFCRLLVNTVLTLLAMLLTFGLKGDLYRKFKIYVQLIAWHLKGCP